MASAASAASGRSFFPNSPFSPPPPPPPLRSQSSRAHSSRTAAMASAAPPPPSSFPPPPPPPPAARTVRRQHLTSKGRFAASAPGRAARQAAPIRAEEEGPIPSPRLAPPSPATRGRRAAARSEADPADPAWAAAKDATPLGTAADDGSGSRTGPGMAGGRQLGPRTGAGRRLFLPASAIFSRRIDCGSKSHPLSPSFASDRGWDLGGATSSCHLRGLFRPQWLHFKETPGTKNPRTWTNLLVCILV